jgi:uncharacterized protein (DUF1330 family)
MRALLISQQNLHDNERIEPYRQGVAATLEPFGGKFVVRGGATTVVEGEWPFERTVIIEFPSREKAEAWYRSAACQKLLPLRLESTSGNLVIVDGVD